MVSLSRRWVFVVDTEQYAGNFERELVAHMTGQIGECGVGSENQARARAGIPKDILGWLDLHVVSLPDEDNGCLRPASIWETPGWANVGGGKHARTEDRKTGGAYLSVACFFDARPSDRLIRLMQDRARGWDGLTRFARPSPPPTITGFRLLREETVQVEEEILPEGGQ